MENKKITTPEDQAAHHGQFKYNSFENPAKSDPILLTPPSISLPKGGGALKSIDEKFQVNGANGTLSFSIPIPVTAGRTGFQPSLSLAYNSGSGNSAFGVGWSIDASSIKRKTDKQLPTYRDGDDADTFMFSGAEDLVPYLDENNNWEISQKVEGKYNVRLYRPRIEGSFSRIERITNSDTGIFHWKVTTRDNVVTYFGTNADCRIADPDNASRIFEWLPAISFDDTGNCMVFSYKAEDLEKIAHDVHERNRFNGLAKFANRYLKRIRYGNIQPYFPDYTKLDELYGAKLPQATDFLFEVVFNYGEHTDNKVDEKEKWDTRADAFSDYRAGFEIRTYRLCKSVMMFHHFTNREFGLADNDDRIPYLVKSLDFSYASSSENTLQKSEVTYLKTVKYSGYIQQGNGYQKKSLPAMEFDYEKLSWNNSVKTILPDEIVNAPSGIGGNYQWVDLYNEGISGILTEQAGELYYKSNLGDGAFSRAQVVVPKPSFSGLANGTLQVQDLAADGSKQIVFISSEVRGYFELAENKEWQPFKAFQSMPNFDLRDPNAKFIDLNGDGAPELVISEDHAFTWYLSNGRQGYDSPELAAKPFDDEQGPAIVFADKNQSIFLADMNGDGLTDIVRIRNGEVSFYPNLGYGKFGARVAMSNAPVFDEPDQFNPAYLQLADVSGTGATDIIYLGKNQFKAWLNLSGNSWSDACEINAFPKIAQPDQVSVVDLLGNGTSCIVWSSPLPSDANTPMRYIDLMNGKKPHILNFTKNNFGKETTIEYKNSTHFYLKDKKAGKPWITKLPFPVQCVSKVEIIDKVTDVRYTNKYNYHHGYYDHREREFRGFGLVEQTDTEEYQYLSNVNAANASDIKFHAPPILTRSWFHLGAFLKNKKMLEHYQHEYWYNDEVIKNQLGNVNNIEFALPDAVLANNLTNDELIEAHRACKGSLLRQEVFALDGTAKEKIPYSVVKHNCRISRLQPKRNNEFAVFLVKESESLTYSYERNTTDPRISHTLNLQFDELGNVLKSASVIYPRKARPASITDDRIWDGQKQPSIIVNDENFTTDIITSSVYQLRLPYQNRKYEWRGLNPVNNACFKITDFNVNPGLVAYEKDFTPNTLQGKLIEHALAIYLNDDLVTPMPVGKHHTLAIKYESYQLAFTTALLNDVYNPVNAPTRVDAALMVKAKYIDLNNDGNWWVRSGTAQYIDVAAGENSQAAALRFYSPRSYTSPSGSVTTLSYYKNYFLLIQKTKDAKDNEVSVEQYDFRTLFAKKIKDVNGNYSAVAIDTLGLIVATAMSGKGNDADDLVGFNADLTDQQTQDFFNDPLAHGSDLLQHASVRIVYNFAAIPCGTGTIVREEHHSQNANAKLQYGFEYSDGTGGVTLRKIQAEPGDAPHRDVNGKLVKTPEGALHLQHTNARWVGDGRTVLNNKGKPIKQYEPYFSDSHRYDGEPELRETGVTSVLYYDAIGRIAKTELPDDTFLSYEYESWLQKSYDANDTVTASKWYTDRINHQLDLQFNQEGRDPVKEQEAAEKASVHDGTPAVFHLDVLGRKFFTVAHNRHKDFADNTTILEDFYSTYVHFDVEGNVREVTDARNNKVMKYKYDMLGNHIYQLSMDAGEAWRLPDVMGKPITTWDSKDQKFETEYDELHRPLTVSLIRNNVTTVIEKYVYSDVQGLTAGQVAAQQQSNLLSKAIEHYDSAGIVRLLKCDFKNNPLETSRELCTDYKTLPDWTNTAAVQTTGEVFVSKTEFDALNRAVRIYTPHTPQLPATMIMAGYNEANLLESVKANVRGSQDVTAFVNNIDYDEKGQRLSILYGNNSVTRYTYDRKTFRMIRLLTTRNAGADILQDLNYTYDPAGNITFQKDNAQQTVYFNNHKIDPHNDYVYDALYRLIQAKGREHIGNNSQAPGPYDTPRTKLPHKGDGNQLQQYTQRYTYDKTGNMLKMQNINSWSREFSYSNTSNQMLTAVANHETGTPFQYQHDAHGNMAKMPHLSLMEWDARDHLQHVGITASADNDFAVQAWYVYDAGGQRIRKVVEKNNLIEERIYLDGFEILRKYQNNALDLQRETVHISDGVKRIALVEHREIGNDNGLQDLIRYQYSNHLGTACLELDGDPNTPEIISYEEYYPFGSTSYQAVRNFQETSKRYRFTGKERDEESGLYYHGARYYAPWLARWTAADPAGISDGANVYLFVSNNPLALHDPTGLAGQPGNNIEDLFLFIRNQAGFETGARAASQGISYTGQTFGTAAHAQATDALADVQKAKFLDADRIFSEVAVQHNTGVVTQIGGSPIKGHHNIDLLAMPKGQTLAQGQTLAAGGAEVVSDIKYGRGKITQAHSNFGQTAVTSSGKTTASTAAEADAIFKNTQSAEDLAKGAKFEAEAIEKSPAVQEYRKAKAAAEAKAAEQAAAAEKLAVKEGTEVAEKSSKVAGKSGKAAKVLSKLGKAGRHLAAAIPFAGIVLGQASAAHAASQGDYTGAILDEAGFIPVAGDLLDAARGGYALGEALDEGLGIGDVAAEYGTSAENLAKKAGLSGDAAMYVGATAAAVSSITVAPYQALSRTVVGLFK